MIAVGATVTMLGLVWGVYVGRGLAPTAPEVPPEPETKPPNVLIVVWDTVRADRLSVYGYDRPTTPRIAKWAEEAKVYEEARSAGIWTLPAHASLFTGLPPESTGADERWLWLDGQHTTMAEWFGERGYDTFTFAANTLLSGDTNLVQGFDTQWNTFKGRVKPMAMAMTKKKLIPRDVSNELTPGWSEPEHGANNAEWKRALYKEAAPLVGRGFVKWVDERAAPERPFFAYINLMEAHTPRIPTMEARQQVMDDEELIELGLRTDAGHINLHFYNFGKHDYTDRELEAINGVYDATLVDLDNATADLFAALDERGILDDTIVVLTSDHGENLGDHHLFNHRFALYESLLHVPLMIRYPTKLEPGRVEEPVATLDLFATLADLAGVEAPDLPSQSLLSSSRSPISYMAVPLEREIKTVQLVHSDVQIEPWLKMGHSVVDDGYKLIRYSNGAHEMYDLNTDPGEEKNLYGSDPSRQAALMAKIDAWNDATPPYDESLRTEDAKTVRANQQDLKNQLAAMGYITDDEDEEEEESEEASPK